MIVSRVTGINPFGIFRSEELVLQRLRHRARSASTRTFLGDVRYWMKKLVSQMTYLYTEPQIFVVMNPRITGCGHGAAVVVVKDLLGGVARSSRSIFTILLFYCLLLSHRLIH